jgi:hypothetical protein
MLVSQEAWVRIPLLSRDSVESYLDSFFWVLGWFGDGFMSLALWALDGQVHLLPAWAAVRTLFWLARSVISAGTTESEMGKREERRRAARLRCHFRLAVRFTVCKLRQAISRLA